MDLVGTGMSLKTGYEDQLRLYRELFNTFRSKKMAESDSGPFIRMGPGGRNTPKPLDLSDVPRFEMTKTDLNKVLQSSLIDIGIISIYILITLAGTFMAFIRYDVR
jgi:hypothetical protein